MRFPHVREATKLSRSTVWRMESAGTFPRRVHISANSVGWFSAEIDEWVKARERVAIKTTEMAAI